METESLLVPGGLDGNDRLEAAARRESALARRMTNVQLGVLLIIVVVALVEALIFEVALTGNVSSTEVPYLSVASVPRGFSSNDSFKLVFKHLEPPADAAVDCNTTCLLGSFAVGASAQCGHNSGSRYDLCRQVFSRTVTWSGTSLLSDDMRTPARVCLTYAVMVANSVVASLAAVAFLYGMVSSGRGLTGMRRNTGIYYPMYNAPQAAVAAAVLAFASLFGMLVTGPASSHDLVSDGILTLGLVYVSLVVERLLGHLLSIAHSPAYVSAKPRSLHQAHHVLLPTTMVAYFWVVLVVTTRGIFRVLAAYNYGWEDPGVVSAFYDTVAFGAPAYARGYNLALLFVEVAYFLIPHLPMAAVAIEQMQPSSPATFPRIAESVGIYRFANLAALVCIFCAMLLYTLMPPIVFGPGKEAVCM